MNLNPSDYLFIIMGAIHTTWYVYMRLRFGKPEPVNKRRH